MSAQPLCVASVEDISVTLNPLKGVNLSLHGHGDVQYHVDELHLRYFNRILTILKGVNLSLFHKRNVGHLVNERPHAERLQFFVLSVSLAPVVASRHGRPSPNQEVEHVALLAFRHSLDGRTSTTLSTNCTCGTSTDIRMRVVGSCVCNTTGTSTTLSVDESFGISKDSCTFGIDGTCRCNTTGTFTTRSRKWTPGASTVFLRWNVNGLVEPR